MTTPVPPTSNELAQQRTTLAGDRTHLADERTSLALDRTRLAHERTLMAWVRTATSLISFGFTIYKFFQGMSDAKEISMTHRLVGPRGFALVMIGLGVGALVLATIQHRAEMKALAAEYQPIRADAAFNFPNRRVGRRSPGGRCALHRGHAAIAASRVSMVRGGLTDSSCSDRKGGDEQRLRAVTLRLSGASRR